MADVRAKFKVISIKQTLNGQEPVSVIELSPVYGNGDPEHENTKFFKWTPSGSINLGCVNKTTADKFELGKEYYVDFTKAD